MKKTININLAGMVYQIDEDAYNLLETYLEKVKNTFLDKNEQDEILLDIEHRFAEIFSAKLGKKSEVVHIKMVEEAIATLGNVEEIEGEQEAASSQNSQNSTQQANSEKRFYRSTDDKILGGVLGGLGAYVNFDPTWLRLLFVVLAIASVGVPVGVIYLVLWLVVPKAVTASQKLQMKGEAVNLNNLQENIKKNLESEQFKASTAEMANTSAHILRKLLKIVVLIAGVIMAFQFVVFAFAWFFSSSFLSFFGSEYVHLIFNSTWEYFALVFALFFLVAIPIISIFILIYKGYQKHPIAWGKSFALVFSLWFLVLILNIFLIFNVLKNYKTESVSQHYVELPILDTLKTLNIQFDKVIQYDDFEFNYSDGAWVTSGFSVDESTKTLKMNTVCLQIEAATDNKFTLMASASARGRNKEDANAYLDNFTYDIALKNGNNLHIPTALTLIDEDKFRLQTLTYTLSVPLGTKLIFGNDAHHFIKDIPLQMSNSRKYLDNNTWIMTASGLECLSCPEDEELDFEEETKEDSLEKFIEQEISDAFTVE